MCIRDSPGVGRSLAAKVAEKCDKVLAGNSGDQIKCEKDSPYDNVSKKDVKLLGDSKDDKKPDNQIEPVKMEKIRLKPLTASKVEGRLIRDKIKPGNQLYLICC